MVVEGMARPEGFEPPTYGFEARRSIQLSYGRTQCALDESMSLSDQSVLNAAYQKPLRTMTRDCEPSLLGPALPRSRWGWPRQPDSSRQCGH